MELRARWADDFAFRLAQVQGARPGWVRDVFRIGREEAHSKSKQQRASEAGEGLEIVQLMHFSLVLQTALAGAAGRMEEFRAVTLPDECQEWRELEKYARQRASEIAGEGAREFGPFLDALGEMVGIWSSESHRDKPAVSDDVKPPGLPADVEVSEDTAVEPNTRAEFYIGYPESDGDKIRSNYTLKAYFPKWLGDGFSRKELLEQFVVRVHSDISGRLGIGVEIPRSACGINYNERTGEHAFTATLPSFGNGLMEWRHGIEVEMRRPQRKGMIESCHVYRAVRFVRC